MERTSDMEVNLADLEVEVVVEVQPVEGKTVNVADSVT